MKAKATQRRKKDLSTWAITLTYAVMTFVVGMIFPRAEHYFLPNSVSTMSAPAAMGICGAVASGMIALTGIVFSLIFVMVQFSATAYSPRLVIWVARDPIMSHSLGMFTATFCYSLTMLAWVDRESAGHVPLVSGWMVFALLLGSIGMFIALIDRVGKLQINRMLIFTGDQGRKAIRELFGAAGPAAASPVKLDPGSATQTVTYSGRPRVIQLIRFPDLVRLAK